MVLRLLSAGHRVHVWTRTSAKLAPLLEAGAIFEQTPAALATATEVVCLCLLDGAAVEEVCFGGQGLAQGRRARLLVDHSSISPRATQDYAARLKTANGMQWVDAPVSGGVAGARDGSLAIMAGGPPEAISAAAEIMRAYARQVTAMGALGAGQITKLCNQIIVAATLEAIAEVVVLAGRAGVDAARLPQALEGGWADSRLLQVFAPRMMHRQADKVGALDTMLKDIDNAAALAAECKSPAPLTALMSQLLRLASANGLGEHSLEAISQLLAHPAAGPTSRLSPASTSLQ